MLSCFITIFNMGFLPDIDERGRIKEETVTPLYKPPLIGITPLQVEDVKKPGATALKKDTAKPYKFVEPTKKQAVHLGGGPTV